MASGSPRAWERNALSCAARYLASCPARTGYFGFVLLPSGPWQVPHVVMATDRACNVTVASGASARTAEAALASTVAARSTGTAFVRLAASGRRTFISL